MVLKYLDSKRIVNLSTDIADTPTLSDDFTSSGSTSHTSSPSTVGGWLTQAHDTSYINGSTDKLHFNEDLDGNNHAISYDLGSGNVSDTNWTLRIHKFNFSTLTAGAGLLWHMGLSDLDSATEYRDNQDSMGCTFKHEASDSRFECSDGEATTMNTQEGGSGNNITFATSKDYYIEIKRLTALTYTAEIFGDEFNTSILKINGVTTSATGGFRYITIKNDIYDVSGGFTSTIDKIEFFNGSVSSKPTNVQDNSILVEKDTAKRFWRAPESAGADTNTTQTSEQDNSGIDGDPNGGGWGAQFLTGHALVGKEIRSIKVKTKFSNSSGNSVSMTARVYGSTKATLRATSTAISSSTLSQSYQDVTFVFPEGSRATLQAGDHIMIVTETAIMSSGSWLTPVKSTVGTNTHFTSWQGMDVNFYEQDASNGNRELYYNPIVSVTIVPATWTSRPSFSDNYSSSTGWTLSTNMSISGGTFNWNSTPFTPEYSYKPLGLTLSDTLWYADFDYAQSAQSMSDNWSYGTFMLTETSGNGMTTSDDSIGAFATNNRSVYKWYLGVDDEGTATNTGISDVASANTTRYYMRLLRNTATSSTLQQFTDPARTITFATALTQTSVPSTIVGLSYLQHSSGTSTQSSNLTATMQNVKIYDGEAP